MVGKNVENHIAKLTDVDNKSEHCDNMKNSNNEQGPKTYKWDIIWLNVYIFIYLYSGAFYGLYLFLFACSWPTIFWAVYLNIIGSLGMSAGSHRLWTHNSYKAKLPLRILLLYFQSTCYENSIYNWVRDHRVHHKWADTDADPHNSTRGFFFSHVGWLMVKKQKDVIEKGKGIYLKDLEADPVVMFQKNNYGKCMFTCCFIIPSLVPWYFWGEKFWTAWYVCSIFRYMFDINCIWLINSAAHLYGTRPYDKNIHPRQNSLVGYLVYGEGWHNYHHTFPWDYKNSEFFGYGSNLTALFIDACAKIGWAYDLKEVPDEMIRRRILRTGDGSRKVDVSDLKSPDSKINCDTRIWGWGDSSMPDDDKHLIRKFNKLTDENDNFL